MIKERRGVSCWEHAWECKNMHGERSRSAFEQGGEQQGWWEGLILKLGQPQRKGDIWISAAVTLNTLKTFNTAVKSLKTLDMLKLCANAGGSISFSFFYHVFSPEAISEDKYKGEGTLHCLAIWKSPHPQTPPSVWEETLWSKYCTYPITEGGGGVER